MYIKISFKLILKLFKNCIIINMLCMLYFYFEMCISDMKAEHKFVIDLQYTLFHK